MTKITKCSCGSTNFFVEEHLLWQACIDPETDVLSAYKVKVDTIESFTCVSCNKEYNESDFEAVQFC